jgi:Flp pilus assembly protein TadG
VDNIIRRKKAGQTIILLAVALTAIIAMAALAIDGGMAFLDKRRLQVAADAGALAGADALQSLPLPNYSPAHTQAVQVVVDNLPGTTVPATIPTSASFSALALGSNYTMDVNANSATTGWDTYQVIVHHSNPTFFAPAIGFGSTIPVAASAKALSGTYPFALILLDDQDIQFADLQLNGNPATLVLQQGNQHGGAFSNEGIDWGGLGSSVQFNPCGTSGDLWAANASLTQQTNALTHTDGYYGDGGDASTPCANHPSPTYPKSSARLPFPNYPEPRVTGPTYSSNISVPGAPGTKYWLCPGTYTGTFAQGSNDTVILQPGVYRFTNTLGIAGGTFKSATAADYPATATSFVNCSGTPADPGAGNYGVILEIYPTACATNYFAVSGGASVTLASSPRYNNINVYVELYNHIAYPTFQQAGNCPGSAAPAAPGGTHVVHIAGSGATSITGALYGPGDNMYIAGSAAGTGVGQIVCWTLIIAGGGSVTETYNPAYLPYFRGLIQ